jgi:hypothetical protein
VRPGATTILIRGELDLVTLPALAGQPPSSWRP